MYKRTAIREFIVAYLKANATFFNNRVFSGRIKPNIEDENQYPYLIVFTRNEDITEHYTSHTRRELDINIGVIVSDNNSDDMDTTTEESMLEVEKQMSKILGANPIGNDPFNLIDDLSLDSIDMDSESDSRNSIGKAMLTYKAEYEYQRPVGFDLSLLDDFDEIGSIENIQITNDGVPIND